MTHLAPWKVRRLHTGQWIAWRLGDFGYGIAGIEPTWQAAMSLIARRTS